MPAKVDRRADPGGAQPGHQPGDRSKAARLKTEMHVTRCAQVRKQLLPIEERLELRIRALSGEEVAVGARGDGYGHCASSATIDVRMTQINLLHGKRCQFRAV